MSIKKSIIGHNVKKYRHKLGISQDVLSKKANLAFHTIAKIEAGSTPNPSINTALKIATGLEIGIDDLSGTLKRTVLEFDPDIAGSLPFNDNRTDAGAKLIIRTAKAILKEVEDK